MERINLDRCRFYFGSKPGCLLVEEVALWWRYKKAREIMSLVGRLRPGSTRARHTVRALRLFNRARSEYVAIVKKIERLVGIKI